MWFVILKTLLPEVPRSYRKIQARSRRSREMLLVADDANAAYSNPRPLPKCAQTLLPFIAPAYRTARPPMSLSAGPPTSKNTSRHVGTLRSLLSIIWDTEGGTSPAQEGAGGAKRVGTRRRARRQKGRGPGRRSHGVTRTMSS